MKVRKTALTLSRTALCAALVYVLTSFLKIPTATGYVHVGDSAVCFAAAVLPLPYSAFAAGLGASLADLVGGYVSWLPVTFVVKALMTLAFTHRSERILCARNFIALAAAVVINTVGYYLGGALIVGNLVSPLAEIPSNLMQGVMGGIFFCIFALAVDSDKKVADIVKGR